MGSTRRERGANLAPLFHVLSGFGEWLRLNLTGCPGGRFLSAARLAVDVNHSSSSEQLITGFSELECCG